MPLLSWEKNMAPMLVPADKSRSEFLSTEPPLPPLSCNEISALDIIDCITILHEHGAITLCGREPFLSPATI